MKQNLTIAATVAVLGLGLYFLGARLMNSGTASESVLSEEISYMCRETGQIIRGPRDPGPEGIDAGGCKDLVQALYCPKCQSWYPFPSAEAMAHMPMGPRCPKDRAALLEEIPAAADSEEAAP